LKFLIFSFSDSLSFFLKEKRKTLELQLLDSLRLSLKIPWVARTYSSLSSSILFKTVPRNMVSRPLTPSGISIPYGFLSNYLKSSLAITPKLYRLSNVNSVSLKLSFPLLKPSADELLLLTGSTVKYY
jgi:hypothetical protein